MTEPAICSACDRASNILKICSGCKDVKYCPTICQKNHWKTHKSKCKVIQALIKITNKEISLSERVQVLNSDIFTSPENFSIMINDKIMI